MDSPSQRIDQRIRELGGWRSETLARMRALILAADPDIIEEWKWDLPVWSRNGIICTGETYKATVKLTFAKGAALGDPSRLFNSSLAGGTRRAIDIRDGEQVNAKAFKALITAAAKHNTASAKKTKVKKPAPSGGTKKPVKLLSSGNPQIAMADGDAPVQAYIAAMPGWKRAIGKQLDALIERNVPKGELRKAVKWNTPLYGTEGKGFFMAFYCFARYVQVTFFRGTSLKPIPPKASKVEGTRYFEIFEGNKIDKAQMAKWVQQASAITGFLAPKP